MYAVITTGGKQARVTEGERVLVERLGLDAGEEVSFTPVLVVDGETVLAGPDALTGSSVTARVVGEEKGPKVTGFTYKPKTNNRRRWGHRQRYTEIEITGISGPSGATTASRQEK
jgi:large subunit ribosomal protein L21